MQESKWNWPNLDKVFNEINAPEDYIPGLPTRSEIPELVEKIKQWFPEVIVGTESVHLNESFYVGNAFLEDAQDQEKSLLPIVFKKDGEMVAVVTFEKDALSQTLSSRIGAIAKDHRGSGLAYTGPNLLEMLGINMNAALVHYYATLKIPHQQVIAERMGFKLVGIMPAIHLNAVAPGVNKHCYKAIYAKILADKQSVFVPEFDVLTPHTQNLYKLIFEDETVESD